MMFNQPAVQAPEDLAALFSRHMNLDPAQQQQQQQQQHPATSPPPTVPVQEEPKIVYISQHYNHSAHLAVAREQNTQPSPRPASEPPQPEHAAVEAVLRNHSVDPSGLSVSQLQLFKTVDEPQQLRLIELWRVCPPTNSNDNPTLAWTSTTVEQEETLARMRREQQLQQQGQVEMSLDGTPLTPVQAGDGRWIALRSSHYMEPYIASGYEEMARREYEDSVRRAYEESMHPPKDVYSHFGTAIGGPTYTPATDPVYKSTVAGEWMREAQMASQYGRFIQVREDEEML
ncbi:hypothetical protein VTK73DRAFT_2836 [Phialemonium thermophilum]|uniref:Uncharacterized protein n=1 Tax=Phialemonium thermophilum TaxID=223376 RepID=A0ABR3VNS3_9PEZI